MHSVRHYFIENKIVEQGSYSDVRQKLCYFRWTRAGLDKTSKHGRELDGWRSNNRGIFPIVAMEVRFTSPRTPRFWSLYTLPWLTRRSAQVLKEFLSEKDQGVTVDEARPALSKPEACVSPVDGKAQPRRRNAR